MLDSPFLIFLPQRHPVHACLIRALIFFLWQFPYVTCRYMSALFLFFFQTLNTTQDINHACQTTLRTVSAHVFIWFGSYTVSNQFQTGLRYTIT
jgi:hypothetical protein